MAVVLALVEVAGSSSSWIRRVWRKDHEQQVMSSKRGRPASM